MTDAIDEYLPRHPRLARTRRQRALTWLAWRLRRLAAWLAARA